MPLDRRLLRRRSPHRALPDSRTGAPGDADPDAAAPRAVAARGASGAPRAPHGGGGGAAAYDAGAGGHTVRAGGGQPTGPVEHGRRVAPRRGREADGAPRREVVPGCLRPADRQGTARGRARAHPAREGTIPRDGRQAGAVIVPSHRWPGPLTRFWVPTVDDIYDGGPELAVMAGAHAGLALVIRAIEYAHGEIEGADDNDLVGMAGEITAADELIAIEIVRQA